jgi:hypothetical protein
VHRLYKVPFSATLEIYYGARFGEALAIKVRDNIGCPHFGALRSMKMSARHYVFRGWARFTRLAERVHQQIKTTKDQERERDVDVPKSLAAVRREYLVGKKSGELRFASREGNPLLQLNINRDWLHRILEEVELGLSCPPASACNRRANIRKW